MRPSHMTLVFTRLEYFFHLCIAVVDFSVYTQVCLWDLPWQPDAAGASSVSSVDMCEQQGIQNTILDVNTKDCGVKFLGA